MSNPAMMAGPAAVSGLEEPSAKRPRRSGIAHDQVKICHELYETLRTHKTEGGRMLCQIFIRAPSKRNCPDYHEMISNPVDLMRVHSKLKNDEYSSVEELTQDVSQMVENTKMFFKKSSQEHRDAEELWEVYNETKNRLLDEDTRSDVSISMKSRDESPGASNLSLRSNSPSRQSARSKESPGRGDDAMDLYLLEELVASVVQYTDETGRPVAEPFKLLPSSEVYPEYYVHIKHPIDLRLICMKLLNGAYKSINQLEKDLLVMCKNAKTFNEPKSSIYQDSQALRKFISNKRSKLIDGTDAELARSRAKHNHAIMCEIAALIPPTTKRVPTAQELGEDESESEEEIEMSNPRWKLYLAVRNFRHPKTSVLISEPFCKLPDPDQYPDYFEEVKHPMSLFMIKSRIRINRYNALSDMLNDLNLMFENAKLYNIEHSTIHQNACMLQDFVNQAYSDIEAGGEIKFMTSNFQQPALSIRTTPSSTIRRKRSEDGEGNGATATKRQNRKPGDEAMQLYRNRLLELYNSVYGFKDETGRALIAMFLEKPSRKNYPDYYQVIKEPIDMKTIKLNIDNDRYGSIQLLENDLELLFNNAKQYNEPGSQIYMDASLLQTISRNKLREIGSSIESPRKEKQSPSARTTRSVSSSSTSRSKGTGRTEKLGPNQKRMWKLFETIREYVDPQGRKLSAIFMKLPSRAEYPDYYDVIRKPLDMQKIQQRLNQNSYANLEALAQDFCLMFDNACRYNDPESFIYKDALTLQRIALQTKKYLISDIECGIPDVQAAVQELLLDLFLETYNHQDDEGRSYIDSFGELPDLQREAGISNAEALTLDKIKTNLDRKRYRRLDRFQADMFQVFESARHLSRSDSQLFEDSLELQRRFIQLRDDLCKNGEHLFSRALAVTEKAVQSQVEELRKQKERAEQSEDASKPQDPHSVPSKRKDGETEVPGVEFNGIRYKVGDFAYVKSKDEKESHIIRIERAWLDDELKQYFVNGNWYYRPRETYHLRTRKFLEKEVFKTVFYDTVDAKRLIGKCYVLFVKDYFTHKPMQFDEKDVYVCESMYLGRVRHFKKMKSWPYDYEQDGIELVPRSEPLDQMRFKSEFIQPKESEQKTKDSGEGDESLTGNDGNDDDSEEAELLDVYRENVTTNYSDGEPGCTYYEQLKIDGAWYKLGDGVYLRSQKDYPETGRIDKIWTAADKSIYLIIVRLARPIDIDHEPSRTFYKREVFITPKEEAVPASEVIGKCAILSYKDFCTFRPTEINENDCYIVESKLVDHADMEDNTNQSPALDSTRKSSKLKLYRFTNAVVPDELYIFNNPITPEKEPSPLLMKEGSSHEINIDELLENMEFPPDGDLLGTPGSASKFMERFPKSKSGYILFSAEVRKRVSEENPDSTFGMISRLVGAEWRNLPEEEKKKYEDRAQAIAEERKKTEAQHMAVQQDATPAGYVRVFCCRWNQCDYQFDSAEHLYQHITGANGHTSQTNADQPVCLWFSCVKRLKEGKNFPTHARLHRHVREKHIGSSIRVVPPNQLSRHYVPSGPPTPLQVSQHSNSSSNFGLGIQQMAPPTPHNLVPQQMPGGGIQVQVNEMVTAQVAMPGQPLVVYNVPGQPQQHAPVPAVHYQQAFAQPPPGIATHQQMFQVPQQAQPNALQILPAHQPVQAPMHYADAGRTIVQAPPKPPEPKFVAAPVNRVQRVLHSEAYLRYIESLSRPDQETVSQFDSVLAANDMNTPIRMDQLRPSDWFARCPENHSEATKAVWNLREYMLKDAMKLQSSL